MLVRARGSFTGSTFANRLRNDSGWSALLLAILLAVVAGGVIVLVGLLGGRRPTVASRSAAAFEEAQQKGIPIGEAAHGHGAASPAHESGGDADPDEPADPHVGHGSAGVTGKPEVPGHAGHATAMAGERSPHAGMQHGAASGSPPPSHAGMQHGTRTGNPSAASPSHAGMQHGTPAAASGTSQPTTGGHAGHGGSQTGGVPAAPLAKSAVASPGQPAVTLEPDPLDAPANTSELDAKRAAAIAGEMGSGAHGMHGAGSYTQLDAGRESVSAPKPATPDHRGMDHPAPAETTKPAAPPPRPVVTPAPTPREHVHPGGGTR